MKFKRILTSLIIPFYFLLPGCSQEEESIRLGLIDPLSGPFANVGEHVLRELQLFVDEVNQRGGVLNGIFSLCDTDQPLASSGSTRPG